MPSLLLLFVGGPDLGWEELFVQITVEPSPGTELCSQVPSGLRSDRVRDVSSLAPGACVLISVRAGDSQRPRDGRLCSSSLRLVWL